MKRLLAFPRRALVMGGLAALVIVVAAGYGYAAATADNQTYTGCLQNGELTAIAIGSTPFKPCPKNATQISWSQTGPPGTPGTPGTNGTPGTPGTNGTNGVSVSSATEGAGEDCAFGGSQFTAFNGVTYACNGAKGDRGLQGEEGAPGQSLTATPLAEGDTHCDGNGGVAISPANDVSTVLGYLCNGARGVPGADGAPGGLDCADELRIKAAAPNFALSAGCVAPPGEGDVCDDGDAATYDDRIRDGVCAGLPVGDPQDEVCNGLDDDNNGQVDEDLSVAVPNGVLACVQGAEELQCNVGFADSGGSPETGCEINLMTDPNNCGSVGNVVSFANATGACANGQAVIVACNTGFGDANGNAADGCEVNLLTNVNHCGAVGNAVFVPNAIGGCVNGHPVIVACNTGFADADHVVANGCEVNLQTDVNNCGAIGNHPPVGTHANWACAGGVLVITACQAGWFNANGSIVDGCEFQADSFEPNDTQGTARSVGSLGPGGGSSINANVTPFNDDWFSVVSTGCSFFSPCGFRASMIGPLGMSIVRSDGVILGPGQTDTTFNTYTYYVHVIAGSGYTPYSVSFSN